MQIKRNSTGEYYFMWDLRQLSPDFSIGELKQIKCILDGLFIDEEKYCGIGKPTGIKCNHCDKEIKQHK